MTRPVAVLRPEPGNGATAARIEAAGMTALRLPMFRVQPVAWTMPDPADFDALLLTSANAIRHGGSELSRLRSLPVIAVGEATAHAARDRGFHVERIGQGGVRELLEQAGGRRLLHLAGRDRIDGPGNTITVYASETVDIDAAQLRGSVALVHSARAGARLADIVPDRRNIALVAISTAVAAAAGDGWRAIAIAQTPTEGALIATARALAD